MGSFHFEIPQDWFVRLIIDQHLMHHAAEVVCAGEPAQPVVENMSVEDHGEVWMNLHQFAPKIFAVVRAIRIVRRAVGVRIPLLRISFRRPIVTGFVVIHIGVGNENRAMVRIVRDDLICPRNG